MKIGYEYSEHKELIILIAEKLKGKTQKEVDEILYNIRDYISREFTLN